MQILLKIACNINYFSRTTGYITGATALKFLCVWLITLIISLIKQVKSNQEHQRCKEDLPRTITDLAEQDLKSNG